MNIALLTAVYLAIMPVEPKQRWDGTIADESLKSAIVASDYVADAETFAKLWKAWRPEEDVPSLDFAKELILVGVVPGPNRVLMQPTLDERGDLKFDAAGTKRAGPGFGYLLLRVGREGVRSVNGKEVAQFPGESPKVCVLGTLHTGVFAVGGETTGTTITTDKAVWELDLHNDPMLLEAAKALHRKKAVAEGRLVRKAGVEVGERRVLIVASLKAAE